MAAPGPAAGNWEPAWSTAHKRWFYQDRKNGLSAWSRPSGCTLELPKDPPNQVSGGGNPLVEELPFGWECEWDSKHKMHYYFNRTTRERVWKKPQGISAPLPAAKAPAVPTPVEPQRQAFFQEYAGGAASSSAAGGSSAEGGPAGPGGAAGVQGRTLQVPAPLPGGMVRGASAESSPTSPSPREQSGQRRAPASGSWDGAAFLEKLARAKATGDQDAVKAVRKEVAEHNYDIRHQWSVPRTTYVSAESCLKARAPSLQAQEPTISFSEATTADAVLMFAQGPSKPRVCALNFANGVKIGGGYKNGALAQEEDLCRRIPSLFTSLFNAKRDGYYPFGPSTCSTPSRPEKYSDVLWTPSVAVARAGEDEGFALLPPERQASVSLVAAAAPNIRFAKPRLDIKDVSLMYDTVKTIFLCPRMLEPEVSVLVLGAWGCGAFGGDPQEVSELFCRALAKDGLGRLYREVHFAIPKGGPEDTNADKFREALRRHGIAFKELSTARRR